MTHQPTTLQVAYIASAEKISITLNGRFRALSLKTDQGQKLLAAVKRQPQDIDEIARLACVTTYLTMHTFGRVTVDDRDNIRLDGEVVDYGVAGLIVRMIREGEGVSHLAKFIENIDLNSNKTISPQVFSFLEKGGMPITPDGCFHAFKRVDPKFKSYTKGEEDCMVVGPDGVAVKVKGYIPHHIGGTVSMNREDCNPDRNQTCSRGLHFCSFDYLSTYHGGKGKVVIVKINPRDVTAIPSDYNDAKGRCCHMEIVGEVPESEAKGYFPKVVERRYVGKTYEEVNAMPGWQDKVIEPDRPTAADLEIMDQTGWDFYPDGDTDGDGNTSWPDYDLAASFTTLGPDEFFVVDMEAVNVDGTSAIVVSVAEGPCDDDAGDIWLDIPNDITEEIATALGEHDGEKSGEEDTEFLCDPFVGGYYAGIPPEFEDAYLIAFCEAYFDAYRVDVLQAHAVQHGYSYGVKAATKDKRLDQFFPNPVTEGIPDTDIDSYSQGFLLGYLHVWKATV